jgi:hypothetical protein
MTDTPLAWAAFLALCGLALVLMLVARLSLAPRWNSFSRLVPKGLVHRWSLGSMALSSLGLFFVAPYLLMGRWDVALAGLAVSGALMGCFGRDVLAWVFQDLKDHWREGRSLFAHGHDCVAHQAYPRPGAEGGIPGVDAGPASGA